MNSSSQQKNNFKRNFSKKKLLIFNENYKRLNDKNEYIFKISANNSIIESKNDIIIKDLQLIDIYSTDYRFCNKKQKKAILPVDSEILFIDNNILVFNYNLKIGIQNLKTNISKFNIFNDLKIMSLTSLDLNSKKFLCFGELFENDKYNLGFYVIDIVNETIIKSRILKTKKNQLLSKVVCNIVVVFKNKVYMYLHTIARCILKFSFLIVVVC